MMGKAQRTFETGTPKVQIPLLTSKPTVFGLLACALLLSAAAVKPAAAQSASTFQNSCVNVFVSGDILSADCRGQNGVFTRTSIEIPGIANIDGVLQFTGDRSSFQNSCRGIRVDGDVLSALCRRGDGGYTPSSIEIPDIVNIDGVLQYAENGPPAVGEPPPDMGDETFFYNGGNYEWYDEGWNGPGFYIVGYQFRRGHGYGGGEGWHGWRHRHGFHPNGASPTGGHREFRPGAHPEFHPNQRPELHPGGHPEFHTGSHPEFHRPEFHAAPPHAAPFMHPGGGQSGANVHPNFHPGGAAQGGGHPGGGHPRPADRKPQQQHP